MWLYVVLFAVAGMQGQSRAMAPPAGDPSPLKPGLVKAYKQYLR